jgi:hypothetical protein
VHITQRETVSLQRVNCNVNTRRYSAARAGGQLNELRQYDKRADRKWEPIFVKQNGDSILTPTFKCPVNNSMWDCTIIFLDYALSSVSAPYQFKSVSIFVN